MQHPAVQKYLCVVTHCGFVPFSYCLPCIAAPGIAALEKDSFVPSRRAHTSVPYLFVLSTKRNVSKGAIPKACATLSFYGLCKDLHRGHTETGNGKYHT